LDWGKVAVGVAVRVAVAVGVAVFVGVGVAVLAERFEDFTFSPSGASVFHLGNYGTAAAKLKDLNVK
jgi:hypothetical protein